MLEASKDFKLRGVDDGYLSIFLADSVDEGRQIATVFRIRDGNPDKVDFVLFPRRLLLGTGIIIEAKPDSALPEFLSSRHWGMLQSSEWPSPEFIRRLLTYGSGLIAIRMSKHEVFAAAREMIKDRPELIEFVGVHWRQHVLAGS